ncbi:lysozyme inhibitor LprI family protein [Methylomonas sp. MgM2]
MRVKTPNFMGAIFAALTFGCMSVCFAIDNPDAPDWLADFEASSARFELAIQQAQNQVEMNRAYTEYRNFLDLSLNEAYMRLKEQLDRTNKKDLTYSQRRWLKFRDAEFDFIDQNWTIANFGSSSVLSRNAYRSQVVKNRVVTLLQYLKNYPARPAAD